MCNFTNRPQLMATAEPFDAALRRATVRRGVLVAGGVASNFWLRSASERMPHNWSGALLLRQGALPWRLLPLNVPSGSARSVGFH